MGAQCSNCNCNRDDTQELKIDEKQQLSANGTVYQNQNAIHQTAHGQKKQYQMAAENNMGYNGVGHIYFHSSLKRAYRVVRN